MICYIVLQGGGGWVIEAQGLAIDYYSDRVRAIDAAIDLAAKDGEAGRPAKVLAQENGYIRDIWTYGRDLSPTTPGYPASGRSKGAFRTP